MEVGADVRVLALPDRVIRVDSRMSAPGPLCPCYRPWDRSSLISELELSVPQFVPNGGIDNASLRSKRLELRTKRQQLLVGSNIAGKLDTQR